MLTYKTSQVKKRRRTRKVEVC